MTAAPKTGQEGTAKKQDSSLDPASAKHAEAVCAEMVAEAKRLGRKLQERKQFPADPLQTTTQLIAPAIPVLTTSARRLRALEDESGSPDFEAYVGVYDPILALLRQRVEAGEAGDRERAQDLEAQLLDMIALQRQLAQAAGLAECDVDFIEAFTTPGK
ncbi:MAG TPA: hypothetical protein VF030_02980 [Solirubrobacterales bacterium]